MPSTYDIIQRLKKHFGKQGKILAEKARIHVVVNFKSNMMSANPHYLATHSKGEFIFSYRELTETQLKEGIRRLAEIIL